ncbi:MAG: fasciclin domain-containing protein, partial [Synechococcus sp.]|nr:fasciclin domain-containing protein [Synechococcus sp.]
MANIIETAKGAGCFGTLLTAVEVAGLTAALESPGPFTVFAPVDDAFAALPPGTVQTLVDNPPQLARILKFHVLSGAHSRE